ncbi:unnamed protein product [Adineta steineri]|uniref:F-box domain-containing protein n=1 Tax=Adineta steineri TaxID=433720 RepID=A0A815F636_9BILA|nr:unnamed protein product [Adineta steineri]CAF1320731.1 unnamed protein product [Adineta steineri]CAF3782299.1 unnamed protein product [Adineta steineri]CAF3976382.1 unnamed protein product [Adineta steineri]
MRMSNVPANCFENFSNELFYEIFDYLDGNDIFKIFSNLNYRFQHLITCSSIPFTIKFRSHTTSQFIDCCKTFIFPNRHRILSLNLKYESLINNFFKHCIIDSSFTRLQSVVLSNISINRAVILLFYLKSLPNLLSLNIRIKEEMDSDLSDIYRMIFTLPSLKYNKLSLFLDYGEEDTNISIPLAFNEQFSTIEYMVINHTCTLDNLMSVLCHTPQLHHLICDTLVEEEEFNVTNEQSIILSNLVYIRINNCHIDFDRFEMFIKKVSSQLQALCIKQKYNKAYLDANRWKRLIKNYIPNLQEFIYKYPKYKYNDYETTSLDTIFNQFISPFWVNKAWIFELQINNRVISFSIEPYRKIWFNVDGNTDNALTRFIPTSQLVISGCSSTEQNQTFIDDFKSLIIQLLPNLDSLKVSCMPIMQSAWLFGIDRDLFFQTSTNNKIRKVHLEKMIEIEQLNFLLFLCSYMQYFQVGFGKDMNLELIVRHILMKTRIYIPHLTCLHLNVQSGNEEIVHNLQKLIDNEKLLNKYTIKCIGDNIILRWN